MIDLLSYIRRLPINTDKKLRIFANSRKCYYYLKYHNVPDSFTFVPSNLYYGHEYWMRKYSGYKQTVYGVIEHGVYFGENTTKVGNEEEWDLGSIITFGDSRIKLLNKLYPDYNVIGVGPRLHYAPIDGNYLKELRSKLIPDSKTIAIYPAHSISNQMAKFNIDSFMHDALSYARDFGAKNILVSLHPTDLKNGISLNYEGYNIILVSGGQDSIEFLPRLKAIMTVTDLIYTNSLGTHVGYSVYMNVPNVINIQDRNIAESNPIFLKEQALFANVFNGNNPSVITAEQRELCDYYYGYSHIKTPNELYNEFEYINAIYKKRFNLK